MDKILISACLLGENVKYNGGNNRLDNPIIDRWRKADRLVPVCPEVFGGMSTPRAPSEIIGGRVINSNGDDVTNFFEKGAHTTLEYAQKSGARYAMLKQNSPSCGSKNIYDGTFSGKKISGAGITAALLRGNGIKIFDETQADALDAEMMSAALPHKIKNALKRLNDNGYEAYAVGGCVRDMLMGRIPSDYDLTTNATPNEVTECFADFTVVPTGIKHGTVTVVDGGENIEITTYRIDGEYADNRHPTAVSFTRNLREDLARRDFCMNAIAMDRNGKIADPFGGETDIAAGRIACVGNAAVRFNEDALRILRCIRFASALGFEIEGETCAAVRRYARLLAGISAERIFAELKKLLCGDSASRIMSEYRSVIFEILPQLDTDGYDRAIECMDKCPGRADFRLAMLTACAAPQSAADICGRLKTDGNTRTAVIRLTENRNFDIVPDRVSVRRAAAAFGVDFLPVLADFVRIYADNETMGEVKRIAEKIKADGDCCGIAQLAVNGGDMVALGYEGKEIGTALEKLLDAVMSEKVKNTKEELTDYIGDCKITN